MNLRFHSGPHDLPSSNLTLFDFESSDPSSLIFVEGLTGNQYTERAADVTRYRETIEHLRDFVLTPQDLLSWGAEIKKGYATKSRAELHSLGTT